MSTIELKHRAQIESWLHRPLTDDELRPVASFDELTDDQVAVVAEIRPRHMIAPMLFLQHVVPNATHLEIRTFMDNIEEVAIARRPPPELPDQRIFEHFAARALQPAERARAGTLYTAEPGADRAARAAGAQGPRRRVLVSLAGRAR